MTGSKHVRVALQISRGGIADWELADLIWTANGQPWAHWNPRLSRGTQYPQGKLMLVVRDLSQKPVPIDETELYFYLGPPFPLPS